MAAAAILGDGRVLVTGGYDRPYAVGDHPRALNSVLLFDPRSGEFAAAAPMRVPRARHAAVALTDGRVAVLGGISGQPTASVEVYDPLLDRWMPAPSLAQPRYDHVAVNDGVAVFVLGGSSLSMVGTVEAVYPGTAAHEEIG